MMKKHPAGKRGSNHTSRRFRRVQAKHRVMNSINDYAESLFQVYDVSSLLLLLLFVFLLCDSASLLWLSSASFLSRTGELLHMCSENGAGPKRDELDFEFLGNKTGEPYLTETNVYKNGTGGREMRHMLWFDPTEDYHTYSILWNNHQVV
ncbi:putative xyloglucan endotransglucosylase/hydrolase protein 8 [Glycine soja]